MTNPRTAIEVYETAIQIEKNGAAFYQQAAKKVSDEACQAILLKLAEMEYVHQETFEAMQAGLPADGAWNDPEGEAAQYLQAFAAGHVFDITTDPAAVLGESPGIGEILMTAIGKERDSVMFYLGLKEMAREQSDRDTIEQIIKEEMAHITLLHDQIDRYGGL